MFGVYAKFQIIYVIGVKVIPKNTLCKPISNPEKLKYLTFLIFSSSLRG
jgi:hypothetical protein